VRIEVAESAEKNVVLERKEIVNINQTSDRFWQRFNGSINSGLMYSKANQSTQYTFDTQVNYPRPRWGAGASYDSTLSGNTGANTSTYNNASLYARRLLRWNSWFYTGAGSFLQSSEQNIQLQSNYGGGIGRFLKNTNHARISVTGGFAWQNTRYSESADLQGSQKVFGAMVVGNLNIFRFDKTQLSIQDSFFPALSELGRVYNNTNVTYYVKFFGNFTWNLSFYGNWDNRPPPHSSGSNYGTSSGLGWTFGNK
jgi:hypothetical protein